MTYIPGRLAAAALAAALAATVAGPARADAPAPVDAPVDAPASGPLKVMPLGDSITTGLGSRSVDSYRVDLYERLTAAGLAVDFVGSQQHGTGVDPDHEGHSGWKIAQIAAQVEVWLAVHQPDVVLLQIGTNDMRTDEWSAGAPERLSALVDLIVLARPATHVFVSQIPGAKAAADQRRIDEYNAAVPGIVAAKGPTVHLVDQRSVDGLALNDNFHPNDFGYAKAAWNLYRALEPVLNTSGTAWPVGVNPYRARTAYLCHSAGGPWDCRWWAYRAVSATAYRWQTRRPVTTSSWVWVPGYRSAETGEWVKGRWVWRTRTAPAWVSS